MERVMIEITRKNKVCIYDLRHCKDIVKEIKQKNGDERATLLKTRQKVNPQDSRWTQQNIYSKQRAISKRWLDDIKEYHSHCCTGEYVEHRMEQGDQLMKRPCSGSEKARYMYYLLMYFVCLQCLCRFMYYLLRVYFYLFVYP